MESRNKDLRTPDKRLAAVCGLFCPACHVYIATQEEPERLAMMGRRFQKSLKEMRCSGCRSSKRCFYCETMCFMAKCAAGKGVDFCGFARDAVWFATRLIGHVRIARYIKTSSLWSRTYSQLGSWPHFRHFRS